MRAPASSPSAGPTRLVLAVALVAFHGTVRLSERYLPEYLAALGYGPVVAGALGTLALATAAAARLVDLSELGDAPAVPVVAALAAAGLLSWGAAPSLDALLGTPLTAVGWILLGAAAVQPWRARGPGAALSIGDGAAAVVGPTPARTLLFDGDGVARSRVVAGAFGLGGAGVLATAAFAGGDTVRAGFALLVAAGAAAGLVAAVALALDDERGIEETVDAPPSLPEVREAFASLSPDARLTTLGDALVRFATVMVSLYFVLVVVEYHGVSLAVGGLSLSPTAVFGLFALAEALGAVAGSLAAPRLEAALDRRWLLVGGLAVLSLVPLALVAARPGVVVLAALFALFGCRTAVRPLRPTMGSRADVDVPEQLRSAVRLALVPAPLLGGLLYALGPVTAFSLATTVGLLGVRELVDAIR